MLVRLVTLLDIRRRAVILTPDLRSHRGEYEHTRIPWSFRRKGELLSSWNGCCPHVSRLRVHLIVLGSFATAVVHDAQHPCRISSPSLNLSKNMVVQKGIPTLAAKIGAFCPGTLNSDLQILNFLSCGKRWWGESNTKPPNSDKKTNIRGENAEV